MHLLADDLCLSSQYPDWPNGIGAPDDDIELVGHNGEGGIEFGRKDSVQVGGILYKGVVAIAHSG